jgi:hypothetical protein
VIAVIVVDNHYVLVAFAGGDRETAGLVTENLTRDLDGLLVDPIGAGAVQMLVRAVEFRSHFGDGRFRSERCCGGPKVLVFLSEMPFCRSNGFR